MNLAPTRSLIVLVVIAGAGGCVYLNTLYNARTHYAEGERARLEGRDDVAGVRYDSTISKAARSYRKDPDGRWADDALYLLGRAYLRRGDIRRADRALTRTLEITEDSLIRVGATLYLGAVAALEGDRPRGMELLDRALAELEPGPLAAEGHLLRARIHFSTGRDFAGWSDLDLAALYDRRLVPAADLERLVWGIARDDRERARTGATRLLSRPTTRVSTDTVVDLVRRAAGRWGPGPAADLLEAAHSTSWPPDDRDRLVLLRAELELAAGDTFAARTDAGEVARSFGPAGTEAHLFLSSLALARAARVADLAPVRTQLLPVSGDARVVARLESIRKIEILERRALRGRPLALFAAAELARDELGAPRLARALFLEYADRGEGEVWVGKALLAALDLPARRSAEREDGVLRERLASMASNPYVRASRTGWFPSADFERLERRLRGALDRMLHEVTAEAVRADAILRSAGDTLR